MRKLIHFVGMKKTGNHAIIPWLQKNIFSQGVEGTVIHINDLYPAYTENHNLARPPGIRIESNAQNLVAILSYEDLPLPLIPRLPTVSRAGEVMDNCEVQTMLLLRDPFTAFASRHARLQSTANEGFPIAEQVQQWDETVALWKSYAREFKGDTKTLGGVIPVNYDRWVVDKEYRDSLLRDNFGQQENLDLGRDEVGKFGNGSSIDGFTYQGRASEMDVLGRWKKFLNDPFYRRLFQDEELIHLSDSLFAEYTEGAQVLYEGNPSRKEGR